MCPPTRSCAGSGVGEARGLVFHSPYGCSKGTADQYVLDYARTFGLPFAVFRMSCIYGPHQCGTEDQGWVAHFLIHAIEEKPLTIYGDGKQVRDLLFVDDLVRAFLAAERHMPTIAGRAFNIGGGPGQTMSLLELLEHLEHLHGERPGGGVRSRGAPADQRYYVSDTSAFRQATGWEPRVGVAAGPAPAVRMAARATAGRPRPDGRDHDGGIMKIALVNPRWAFDGSIYFGCREPHLPARVRVRRVRCSKPTATRSNCSTGSSTACRRPRSSPRAKAFAPGRHRRHDGAELPVLAVRAAGTARPDRDRRRPARRGRRDRRRSGRTRSTTPAATLRKTRRGRRRARRVRGDPARARRDAVRRMGRASITSRGSRRTAGAGTRRPRAVRHEPASGACVARGERRASRSSSPSVRGAARRARRGDGDLARLSVSLLVLRQGELPERVPQAAAARDPRRSSTA